MVVKTRKNNSFHSAAAAASPPESSLNIEYELLTSAFKVAHVCCFSFVLPSLALSIPDSHFLGFENHPDFSDLEVFVHSWNVPLLGNKSGYISLLRL